MPLRRFLLGTTVLMVLLFLSNAAAEKFRAAVYLPTTVQPQGLASDDLNGDGIPDFAYFTTTGTQAVIVKLATGPQSYGAPQSYSLPSSLISPFLHAIAIADVNGDGHKDLIVAGTDSTVGFVVTYLNNSNGTFQTGIASTVLTDNSLFPALSSIAVGDFNEDGKIDLALTNAAGSPSGGALRIVKGDGLGHFSPLFTSTDANNPDLRVYAADFNQDGHMDLVAWRFLAADAVIYIGDGHGNFSAKIYGQDPVDNTPNIPPIRSIVVADMNGDNYPDLVVSTNDTIAILLNDMHGQFLQAPAGPGISLPLNFASALTVADFNHDGKTDIAAGSIDGLHIFLGSGNFTFQAGTIYAAPIPTPVSGLAFVDLDADGQLDLVSITLNGFALTYGNADGTFRAAISYDLGAELRNAALIDVNHDGKPDVVGSTFTGPVSLLSRGDGTFSTVPNSGPIFLSAAGDFNGDGKVDLLAANGGSMVQLDAGNGDGTFQPPVDYTPTLSGLAIGGDFNNDGKPDVGFGDTNNGPSSTFQVALNSGTGTFSTTPASNAVLGAVTADFNKDGKLDAAFAGQASQSMDVFLGKGDGTFQPLQSYPLPHNADEIAVADYNGDGILDLIAFGNINKYDVLLGKGDGTFNNPVSVSTPGTNYLSGGSAFLKGDSHADVVFTDAALLYILNGNSNGTLQAPLIYPAGNGPFKPMFADFNGDGTVDIAVSNINVNGTSTVTVLLNCGGTNFSLTDSLSPQSQFGQPVTFAATLSPVGPGCGTPSGSASLTDNGTNLKTALLASGKISITTSTLTVGAHTIAGSYAGDSVFNNRNFSSVSHTVVKANSTTTVSGTPNPALVGQSVTLTAQVNPAFTGVPTGTATFSDGTNTLGQANLDVAGAALIVLNNPAVGTISVTASYAGDSNFNPSSGTLTQHITDFSLSANPDTKAINAGQTATYPVSVTPLGGFQNTVNLTCSGAPQLSNCTITPASATPNGGPASVNVTVSTTAAVAAIQSRAHSRNLQFSAVVGFGLVGILMIPFGLIKRTRTVAMIAICTCLLVLPSCGGGGGGKGPSSPGTPHGTNTLVLTGTTTAGSVTVTHTLNLTLTVN